MVGVIVDLCVFLEGWEGLCVFFEKDVLVWICVLFLVG